MFDRWALLRMLYLAASHRVNEAKKKLRQSAEEIFRGRRKFTDSETARLSALDDELDREKDRLHRIEMAIERQE
jgi:hypothetical protein